MTETNIFSSTAGLKKWQTWFLRLGFLFLPMQEGPQLVAWYVVCFSLLFSERAWLRELGPDRKWLNWLALALGVCLVMGIIAVFWHGYELRTSKASRAFSGVAVLLGLKLALDQDENEWKVCWWYFLVGLALSSAAGLCQYFFGSFPFESLMHDPNRGWQGQLYIPGTETPCASGLHRNRMRFTEILIMAFALLFSYRGPIWRMMPWWLGLGFFSLTAVTAYLTYSWMAVFVSLGAWLLVFVLKATQEIWIARLAMLGSVLGMFMLPLIGSIQRAMSGAVGQPLGDGKLEIRQWLWSTGFEGLLENPLLGKGFGGYGAWAVEHLGINAANIKDPHSWWLAMTTQAGISGFLVMVLVAAICIAFAWRLKPEHLNGQCAPGHAEVLAASCALMVIGMVQDVFFYHGFAQFAWIVVGLALGLSWRGTQVLSPQD